MKHYTEFQRLKRDKDVSTTTLLVVAKRFINAIDRTDCIRWWKCVCSLQRVLSSILESWVLIFTRGREVCFRALCVFLRVHRGLATGWARSIVHTHTPLVQNYAAKRRPSTGQTSVNHYE